jgi:putative FmdB family regulatory protein
MPIFEYQCQQCGHRFEKFRLARQAAEPPSCPQCQAVETRQLISRFSAPSAAATSFACRPSALS